MNLLAFDTTSERLSLALLAGGRVRERLAKVSTDQDDLLPAEAEKLLKAAKLKLKDVDAFVAPTGPGRFTGIRVGLTYATVLAKALKKPAIGVSWLEALAWRTSPAPGKIVVVAPGWKGEFFIQLFVRDKDGLRALQPPRWTAPAGLARAVAADVDGSEHRLAGPAALEAMKLLPGPCLAEAAEEPLRAADLLAPARAMLASGSPGEPAPLYIKPPHYER